MLKFAGVDSISDAEQLAGWEVQIPREQRAELEAGAAYVSELVGCEVWISSEHGREVAGHCRRCGFEWRDAPLLVVRRQDGQEYLVPYAEEFLAGR